jgi:hypothetical protein
MKAFLSILCICIASAVVAIPHPVERRYRFHEMVYDNPVIVYGTIRSQDGKTGKLSVLEGIKGSLQVGMVVNVTLAQPISYRGEDEAVRHFL